MSLRVLSYQAVLCAHFGGKNGVFQLLFKMSNPTLFRKEFPARARARAHTHTHTHRGGPGKYSELG